MFTWKLYYTFFLSCPSSSYFLDVWGELLLLFLFLPHLCPFLISKSSLSLIFHLVFQLLFVTFPHKSNFFVNALWDPQKSKGNKKFKFNIIQYKKQQWDTENLRAKGHRCLGLCIVRKQTGPSVKWTLITEGEQRLMISRPLISIIPGHLYFPFSFFPFHRYNYLEINYGIAGGDTEKS